MSPVWASIELHLNGRKVGDAVLTPCRTEFRRRVLYDSYDVTELLQQGENVLGLMLGNGWFNGQKRYWGWQYQWYGSPRALLQLEIDFADGTRARVVTDGTWRASWGPVTFNCLYDGEDYDARLEQPGWDAAGFDDAAWAPANVVPSPGGRLAANPAPSNRVLQMFVPVSRWESAPGVFIFDMGVNYTGWVRLRVHGARGTMVQLRYAEGVIPEGDGALDTTTIGGARAALRYTLRGDGEETYEPRFTYCGFQYVEVTGFPGTPALDALTGCFVHADVSPAGEFACADGGISHLHRCMVQSQRCNLQMGVPTDDTQRAERLGWGADAWASAPQALHNFSMARLYRKWIGDFRDCQLPSGMTNMIVPSAGPEEDLVWSAAYLFIPWWMYVHSGDRRMLEEFYPYWEAYLAYLATRGRAVFLQRPLETDPLHYTDEWETLPMGHLQRSQWGDHLSTAEGYTSRSGLPNSISTAFYARLVGLMAQISTVLGLEERAQHYRALMEEIREAYNGAFFNGTSYDQGGQSSQAWALEFGLAPAGREATVFIALCVDIARHGGHPTSGYPGTPCLVEALTAGGRPDLVWQMAQLTDYPSWQFMVRGKTTIPEAWDGTSGSWNHHALASPLDTWLYTTLAGIHPDPAAPGFAHIIITPYIPSDLAWARASLDTLRGVIASHWRHSFDSVHLTVTIPANTHATVRLPHPRPEEVRESGEPVAGVLQDGATVVEIGSGRYRFDWPAPFA